VAQSHLLACDSPRFSALAAFTALVFAVAFSAFLCVFAFSFAVVFESATYNIISQKQPKTSLSSPQSSSKSHNSNIPKLIPAKKSLHFLYVQFGILKK